LGLRQVVMVLMDWAIDVPQKLLQSDAKPNSVFNIFIYKNILQIKLEYLYFTILFLEL
jgi:hypothetical protein